MDLLALVKLAVHPGDVQHLGDLASGKAASLRKVVGEGQHAEHDEDVEILFRWMPRSSGSHELKSLLRADDDPRICINVTSRHKLESMIAFDTNALPWEPRPNEKLGRTLFRKNLVEDPDTGMEVRIVRYPAGVINVSHTHPCAHGMYVIEGVLQTHDGAYGPGHFVWFPEGEVMEHGATAEGDVTVLFITNKPFEIHYK